MSDLTGLLDHLPAHYIAREKRRMHMAMKVATRYNHPVLSAKTVIIKAIEECGDDLILGWSGGKCSTVALHIALQIKPDIRVLFQNTGIEFPENLEYVYQLQDEWNLNLVELKPEVTFWEIVDKYGMPKMPIFGSDRKKRRGPPKKRGRPRKVDQIPGQVMTESVNDTRPMCCHYLKDKPRYNWIKEQGIKGQITGLRASEGRNRAIILGQRGQIYPTQRPFNGFMSYHAVGFWGLPKMEAYLRRNKVPHNKTYDTQQRNGCWACTAYVGWENNIQRYNPGMYKLIQRKRGVRLMDDYFPKTNAEDTSKLPCDGDSLVEMLRSEDIDDFID